MLLIFVGPSCSGKSSAADRLKSRLNAEIWSGKDYLRLAKHPLDAKSKFEAILLEASRSDSVGQTVIFVTTPGGGMPANEDIIADSTIIVFTADLEILYQRFADRLGKNELPAPMRLMIQRQMEAMDELDADIVLDTGSTRPGIIDTQILKLCGIAS